MTLAEQIQNQLHQLPPDKQSEVLDFITFLQERVRASLLTRKLSADSASKPLFKNCQNSTPSQILKTLLSGSGKSVKIDLSQSGMHDSEADTNLIIVPSCHFNCAQCKPLW